MDLGYFIIPIKRGLYIEFFVIFLSIILFCHEQLHKYSQIKTFHSRNSWIASSKKVLNDLSRCHNKRRIGVGGRTHLSFGMTSTFCWNLTLLTSADIMDYILDKSVSYYNKDGCDHAH